MIDINKRNVLCGMLLALCSSAGAAPPSYVPVIIENPIPQEGASFGRSAKAIDDITGDGVQDLMIGARYQDVRGRIDQGRAFLFDGATRRPIGVIDSPRPDAGGSFARDFDSVGDVDGDGLSDLLIGAPFEDVDGVFQQGRAHLFSARTRELIYSFDNPEGHPKSHYGLTVSRLGDVNADDVPDLLIGVHFQHVGDNLFQGRMYIYSGATGEVISQIEHPLPQENAIFADEVAGIGDIDGDGVPDFLTGALGQRLAKGQPAQGRAYVFSGASGQLIRPIAHPEPQEHAHFGDAVASLDDVNADGIPDFIVGARYQDVEVEGRLFEGAPKLDALPISAIGTDAHCIPDLMEGERRWVGNVAVDQGVVYVFSGANGALLHKLANPQVVAGAAFGTVVDSSDDVDGDGVRDVLVGAPFQDVGMRDRQGQAFVFSGRTGELLVTLDNPTPQRSSGFGFPIASAGDLNDDGWPELLVGASGQQVGLNASQGRMFLFMSEVAD
jgi:hypothetical protein